MHFFLSRPLTPSHSFSLYLTSFTSSPYLDLFPLSLSHTLTCLPSPFLPPLLPLTLSPSLWLNLLLSPFFSASPSLPHHLSHSQSRYWPQHFFRHIRKKNTFSWLWSALWQFHQGVETSPESVNLAPILLTVYKLVLTNLWIQVFFEATCSSLCS